MHSRFLFSGLLIALLTLSGAGCSSFEVKPWVSPYERNNLADPIMSFNRAPVAQSYMHHVYQVREGRRRRRRRRQLWLQLTPPPCLWERPPVMWERPPALWERSPVLWERPPGRDP